MTATHIDLYLLQIVSKKIHSLPKSYEIKIVLVKENAGFFYVYQHLKRVQTNKFRRYNYAELVAYLTNKHNIASPTQALRIIF